MCDKPETETPVAAGASNVVEPAVTVDLSGFSSEEVARLEAKRDCVEQGTLNEDPTVYRRLRFVRWLYEQGQPAV
jgi:hypothetical protein